MKDLTWFLLFITALGLFTLMTIGCSTTHDSWQYDCDHDKDDKPYCSFQKFMRDGSKR